MFTILISGCIVQSITPFYSSGNQIPIPDMVIGQWQILEKNQSTTQAIKPWVFTSDSKLQTFNEKHVMAEFDVIYFKINQNIYMDSIAGDHEPELSEYWTYHVFPAHVLTKIEIKDDLLVITPLDYDWIIKNIEIGEIKLSSMKGYDNMTLFHSTSEEWEQFLKKYGDNKDAFPENNALYFKKALHSNPDTHIPDIAHTLESSQK